MTDIAADLLVKLIALDDYVTELKKTCDLDDGSFTPLRRRLTFPPLPFRQLQSTSSAKLSSPHEDESGDAPEAAAESETGRQLGDELYTTQSVSVFTVLSPLGRPNPPLAASTAEVTSQPTV